MSSGNVERTLLYQVGDVLNLMQEGKRRPVDVSRILQGIIADHDFTIRPKAEAVAGVFHVVGNFTSAAAAIEAGKYPVKWGLAENPAKIPLIVQPVDCRVRAVRLGRRVKVKEMFGLYPRIVDPMTCFTFGARFPEEQEKATHITVWMDAKGRFLCALLFVFGGRRRVVVGPVGPEFEFGGVFLVLVRE